MTATSQNAKSHVGFKRSDLHQQVTDTIIRQLEAGVVPWHRPWKGDDYGLLDIPKNTATGNKYRGINIVLLWSSAIEKQYPCSEWASFKQWQDKKEMIRKGEKGTMIVYFDFMEREEEGETKKIPFLKSSIVFNRCQLASYQPEKPKLLEPDVFIEKIQRVDDFVENSGAVVKHDAQSAYYQRAEDIIHMPVPEAFQMTATCTATEGYYSTLLHELTHWSGAPHRLDRTKGRKFGDKDYATEELVAELGAAFLCAEFDITTAEKGDHASYIDTWLQVLKNDKYCVVRAAAQASKAVDYLIGLKPIPTVN